MVVSGAIMPNKRSPVLTLNAHDDRARRSYRNRQCLSLPFQGLSSRYTIRMGECRRYVGHSAPVGVTLGTTTARDT
jgi:hypothetical protein